MLSTILSILVLAGAALLWGAWALWRRGAPRKRIVLMVLAAALLFANVAIWTVPMESGSSPAEMVGD
mgnify:CR=1 FL=1